MTRQELARQVFLLEQKETLRNAIDIWQEIAETTDAWLEYKYEKLLDKHYRVVEEQTGENT